MEPVISIYGLKVAQEDECSDYESTDYSYGPHLDRHVAEKLGGYYAAYENLCYPSYKEVTIEHIVARREAHVSGLCKADPQTKVSFANDHDNIALAIQEVNSHKGSRDVAAWLPEFNKCWFVQTVVDIKKKYDLSVDVEELKAIKAVLQACSHDERYLKVPEDCTYPLDMTVNPATTESPGPD